MFIQIGDQQIGWIKGGLFMLGRTAFRPAVGPFTPRDEVAFLERYLRQLELELTDVDRRLAQLSEGPARPETEAPSITRREPAASTATGT